MGKEPVFSDHAWQRMALRGVSRDEVLLTVRHPERMTVGRFGAANYYRTLNGRTIRVTVGSDAHDADQDVIVTVAVKE